ncbi:MAG: phosphatase PAP2 family protein [Bacteroidota bacterium]|nr:phosphatase PAP2 family protein [Bacteroidota bacterium]
MNELDHLVFTWINQGLINPVFDFIMPWLRESLMWVPFYAFLLGLLIINFGKRAWLTVLLVFITILVSDQLSSQVFKPLIGRPRPCQEVYFSVRSLVKCGSGLSMPSSHATNHWAVAIFFMSILPKQMGWKNYVFPIWAFSICFAQIYVGLHFPLDIISGLLLGSFVARLFVYIGEWICNGEILLIKQAE